MNKKEETTDTYNRGALKFTEKFNAASARIKDIEQAFSYISKLNPKVLELGCGNGRDANEILKHSPNYLGVDYSEELIKIAKNYCPDGKFHVVDFENWKFPDNLDVIFAFASLLHSDKYQLKTILEKAAASLDQGGVFLVSLKYAPYHEERKTEDIGSRTFYFYTPEDIVQLSPPELKSIFHEIQDLRGQRWFTIVLQKSN